MPVGQLVVGSPGSGKTTYCWGLQQFFSALGRPISIINLDPAVPSPPYTPSLSLPSSLISLESAMSSHSLGPNGALLYCMEYLEANVDWLLDGLRRLEAEGKGEYVVFDIPGQVELSTNHDSLANVMRQVEKAGWRLAAVHLIDSTHIVDASKYVSLVLLSLRAMLQLGLPHINVLSKVDLLEGVSSDLPLNLDFYTEVQDLSYLEPLLEKSTPRNPKFRKLNRAIIDLIEDFNLVGFETLCVEDKESMAHLVGVIDRALGYHPPPPPPDDPSNPHPHRPHIHSHPSLPSYDPLTSSFSVAEKYISFPSVYREHEREAWEREGEQVARAETERSERREVERGRWEVEEERRKREEAEGRAGR